MTRVSELHDKSQAHAAYAEAYDELETDFDLARQMIEARARAGLTQDELAARTKTSRAVIARLESGSVFLDAHACSFGCHHRQPFEDYI